MMFDKRTRGMIKNCENAIKLIEKRYMDQFGADIMIFTQEELWSKVNKEMTYTKIMYLEFVFIIVIAAISLIAILICAV